MQIANPDIPAASTNPSELTVVIIFGSAEERSLWTSTGREHFGPSAYLYNEVTDVGSLSAVLAMFPPRSIGKLVFGGHGWHEGLALGNDESTYFNATNLAANPEAVRIIRNVLSGTTAVIECQCCLYGENQTDIQIVANLLNAVIRAYTGIADYNQWDWPGDDDGVWVTLEPK